jgi:DNA-binding PadR family transcriptional regulator
VVRVLPSDAFVEFWSCTLYFYVSAFKPGKGGVHIDKDLVAASATPLVLAILAEGESYGYAILKRIRSVSDGELEWTDGMLYPLLHRLRRLGYVTTEWRLPPEGRRRNYYMITDAGRAALAEQRLQWATVTRALNDIGPGARLAVAVREA